MTFYCRFLLGSQPVAKDNCKGMIEEASAVVTCLLALYFSSTSFALVHPPGECATKVGHQSSVGAHGNELCLVEPCSLLLGPTAPQLARIIPSLTGVPASCRVPLCLVVG